MRIRLVNKGQRTTVEVEPTTMDDELPGMTAEVNMTEPERWFSGDIPLLNEELEKLRAKDLRRVCEQEGMVMTINEHPNYDEGVIVGLRTVGDNQLEVLIIDDSAGDLYYGVISKMS